MAQKASGLNASHRNISLASLVGNSEAIAKEDHTAQVLIDVLTMRPRDGPSRLFGVHPTELGPKEAEMRIVGCDLHARQQMLAMLDSTTGEVVKATLKHEGNMVREFYGNLPRPVRVGIEATGSMQWFVNLMEELGIECLVGHPAEIRAAEPRKQKHHRRDADLLLSLLVEERFPAIWLPTKELLDLRALLRHRHQWVGLRVKIQNALQAMAQRLGGLTKQGNPLLRFLWSEAAIHAVRRDPELKQFYRRKLIQKGLGKARAAVACKLGILKHAGRI
jgi:hypothetical protein